MSGNGKGEQQLRVIRAEWSSDLHGLHTPVRGYELPRSRRSQVGIDKARVSVQIGWLLRSTAPF